MPDEGSRLTDKAVSQVERRIRKIYKEAEQDIARKMADFTAKHARKDAEMRAKLNAGEITKEEYQRWQRGQVFIGKQWEAKKESIAETLHHANETAQKIVNEQARNVFATNFNWQNYELEHTSGIDMGFGLYDSATVGRLIRERPQLLPQPKPGKYKDNRWNNRNIINSITQSIIQGESIPEAAKRLAQTTGETNMKAMRMHTRTALTGAQNAGRIEAMHEQQEMGIEVKKKWIATLDDRTRDTHGELDGQTVGVDEPFTVDGMEIMFPGDKSAPPELVYNCRCKLGYIYPKYDHLVNHDRMAKVVDEDGKVHYENVGNVTFKEWQEGKRGEAVQPETKETAAAQEPKEEPRWRNREEYEAAKANKEIVYNQEREQAETWYDEESDKLLEQYGGPFGSQRVAIRMDNTLSDVEKERKLEEIDQKREKYMAEREKIAQKRDAMMTDALRKMNTTFDPEYEYNKIAESLTLDDNVRAVNPHYLDGYEYQINCQSCSFGFEARMRGYDVEATAASQSRGMGAEAHAYYAFGKAELNIDGTGHSNTLAIRNQMLEWGDGARGIVSINRSGGGGHMMNVAVRDGHFYVIDSQVGLFMNDIESGTGVYGLSIEDDSVVKVTLYRTDNKPLNYIPDGWIKKK